MKLLYRREPNFYIEVGYPLKELLNEQVLR